jgi:predicted nucleotidyltransferase
MAAFRNIVRIQVIARALAELKQKIVFVGGSVVDLYCNDPARGEVRPTDDIDVVVELINKGSHADLEEKLRQIGFQHDIESSVICRYKYHDIVVDVMPTDGNILGFTNRWYKDGVSNAIDLSLNEQTTIQVFPVTYFLASKIEALKAIRHGSDYRLNSDFEDIIYIFDNRTMLLQDILDADDEIKDYLKTEITELLKRPFIEEEIAANLEFGNRNTRKERILSMFKTLSLHL